jgi:hypothetical protein
MTQFETTGMIKLPTSRKIVLRDLALLERLNE